MKISIVEVSHHSGLKRPKHGWGKVKVFLHPENETILENWLGGRYTREPKLLRTILWQAVNMAAEDGAVFHGNLDSPKAKWSQKAGCSCSCSPGFVTNLRGKEDVFVDYRLED